MVLKAHKEAVNSLSGNGSAKLGTVAAVVAAANSTALESSKEIEAAMHISLRNALGVITQKTTDGPMDDFAVMKVLCPKIKFEMYFTVSLISDWLWSHFCLISSNCSMVSILRNVL